MFSDIMSTKCITERITAPRCKMFKVILVVSLFHNLITNDDSNQPNGKAEQRI